MNKFKMLARICMAIAIILSDVMCAVVSYYYCELKLCVECSAPPTIAFLYAIPFLFGIIIFFILSRIFYRKSN